MRFIGFCFGLLLAPLPHFAAAQTTAAPPVRDSAFAVHNLFRHHQHAGEGAFGFGLAGLTGVAFAVAHGQRGEVGANALITLVSTALGLRQFLRFSPGREGLIVRQYEQGWPLPADVRRRLKPKYFRASK